MLLFLVVEGEETGRKTDYKYKMSKHIGENSHITLVCPEVDLDSTVEWFQNKQLLNASFRLKVIFIEFTRDLIDIIYNS